MLGAAGGVGLAAVELGKAMGARVIAAASSQEKVDLCLSARRRRRASSIPTGPFDRDGQKALGALFKDATGPNGADVIYDPIGDAYAEPALRSIAWEGKYLVVGFAAGEIPKIPLNLALLKGCEIVGVFWGAWVGQEPEAPPGERAELLADVRRRQDQAVRLRALPAGRGAPRPSPTCQPQGHGQGGGDGRLAG